MNRATLIGHLGADPEKRHLNSGDCVWNLRLATSETWKDKSTGERKERTHWHSVVIFNQNIGGVVEKYAKKGARILIEGSIETRKYQDQSGNDRYTTEIVLRQFAGNVMLLDRAERQAPDADSYGDTRTRPPRESGGRPAAQSSGQGAARYADLDDDIPF